MKQLMLGNAAVARGLYEAGCCVISSYPGTPSTEITEEAVKFPEIYCEWAPNEKVAMEVAFGAALAGKRNQCRSDGSGCATGCEWSDSCEALWSFGRYRTGAGGNR